MDQEKIGKFIQETRKKKKITQQELANKLGVSDRTVGNWENGRNMPDLSLFKPICDELDITVNELLSGEKTNKESLEKYEENIINTIDLSTKKINITRNNLGIILIAVGVILSLTAMTMFPSESSWGSIYSIFGAIISLIGVGKLTKKLNYYKRIIIHFGYFIFYIAVLLIIDYASTVSLKQLPRFCITKTSFENGILCEAPFYNVYRINSDTNNEYIIVDTKKEYTIDTIPKTPFNRNKTGIDNLIKYKNKYVGNNSNDGNLIRSLPLSEYGYVFQIDSKNLGLIINYNITDWYINENYYLEKSLVYNAVSIFALIDNVREITFNFSGKSYNTTRDKIIDNYPNYKEIVNNGINKDNFTKYLEDKLNDMEFIDSIFTKIYN